MRQGKLARKTIRSYILSFIFMLSLICFSIMTLGKYSMLSLHGVIHTCDRIEYFKDINEEMTKEAYYMGIPYGLNKKCVKDIFNNKDIRKNMYDRIEAKMAGIDFLIDTSDIQKKITENVTKELGELNKTQQQSLNSYIAQVTDMYQKKMSIPGEDNIVAMINVSTKISWIGIPVCVLISILCIFFLIAPRKRSYRGLRYVAYGTLGAGVTLLTVFAASISDGFIYKFNISDVYMRKFYTYWLGHEMLMQVFAGIGIIIAGFVMIYMVLRQKFRA